MGEWEERGCVELGTAFEEKIWDSLVSEAGMLLVEATRNEFTTTGPLRDGSFRSPSGYSHHRGGAVFQSILRSREMLMMVRETTGLPRLVPVRCGFNFYRPGDFLGLHRDSVKATVTLTFGLTDNLGTMGWAPDLRHSSNDAVAKLIAKDDLFPKSRKAGMKIPYRSIDAFDGYNIPHWREPFEFDLGILGNFCYFDL